jgi:uncharacterized membrane protein
VPTATKKSNGKIVTTILVVAALGFLVYLITRPSKKEPDNKTDGDKQ